MQPKRRAAGRLERSSPGGATGSSRPALAAAGRPASPKTSATDLHALIDLVERGCPPSSRSASSRRSRSRRGMSRGLLRVAPIGAGIAAVAKVTRTGPSRRRRVPRLAPRPARRRGDARRRGRAAPRAPPARAALRGRPPPAEAPHLRGDDLDDLAHQAADDALMSVLARLDDFRGLEPLHDLGLQVRLARGRGQAPQARLAGTRDPARAGDLEPVLERAASSRTPRPSRASSSRGAAARSTSAHAAPARVLVALALNGVPIDVLAERLEHDARRALQDAARRSTQAAQAPGRARLSLETRR